MYIKVKSVGRSKTSPQVPSKKTPTTQRGTDDEAASSAAASRRASAEWFKRFQEDCKGIRIPERLSKSERGSYDEELFLRKRVNELPELYKEKAKLDERASRWPRTRVFTNPVAERQRLEEIA